MNERDLPRTSITFADKYVDAIMNGEKEATVRYGDFGRVQAGDTLTAVTTDKKAFTRLTIERTATGPVSLAYDVIRLSLAGYTSTSVGELIHTLNKYYDETVAINSTVTVLIFTREDT